ncbi:MAG: TonB-dependent receptor [Porphyrobacter sp.]|nr:TonB-dependent receptor [Porphyrobacter sp.]
MTIFRLLRTGLLAGCALSITCPALAEQASAPELQEERLTDTIIVTARRQDTIARDAVAAPRQIALPADAAAIAARVAGADIFGNGALSGQLSYRGLAGERVLGRVNGQRFATGGPNAMDPPLHYAQSILVERIDVARGVAPVAEGPSLGGAINAQLLQAQFTDSASLTPQMRMASQYRSVDDSYAVGGLAALANEDWRFGLIASREQGEDYRFPGGTAVGTSFARNLYGVHAGFQTGAGELFVEYRRSETDPSGNPPFALDMVYFNTDFVQGGFRGQIAEDVGLTLRLGHVAVRHLMDNQTLRQPAAAPAQARASFADADTMTAEATLRFGTGRAYLEVGADAEITDRFVTITNPTNPAFFIESQPDVRAERVGAYLQWRGSVGAVQFEMGGRIDRTEQSVGIPQLGAAVPMGPRGLAAAFVASRRQADDTTVDGAARVWIEGGAFVPRLTLARKTRVPSVLERFAWLPTEASFGLADGNIYVGNLALEPEVAWIAEAGFDWETDWLTLRPTLFYRRVDGFIQGTPFDATPGVINTPVEMVASMSGDPTPLMFRNADAELYGADLDFVARPLANLELAGTASFTRGQRGDIADDLYRIPPANLRLSATWATGDLSLGAELFVAAEQNRVSQTNGELAGEGYATLGLFARYEVTDALALEAGIENLLDERYAPHLAGRSRVGMSDVPLGERLPGPGRGVWARFTAQF